MDLKEKSLQYAEGKLAEILNSVAAQAYIDGYNEACKENGKEVVSGLEVYPCLSLRGNSAFVCLALLAVVCTW